MAVLYSRDRPEPTTRRPEPRQDLRGIPYNAHVHRGWYGYWDFSGGNASDAIHTLDLARLVLGDPPQPKVVQCVGGRWQVDDGGDMPDVQIVAYQFDGLVMSFFNTGFTPYLAKASQEIRFGPKYPDWPQNADRIEIHGTTESWNRAI